MGYLGIYTVYTLIDSTSTLKQCGYLFGSSFHVNNPLLLVSVKIFPLILKKWVISQCSWFEDLNSGGLALH